jgi:hypothetical protein
MAVRRAAALPLAYDPAYPRVTFFIAIRSRRDADGNTTPGASPMAMPVPVMPVMVAPSPVPVAPSPVMTPVTVSPVMAVMAPAHLHWLNTVDFVLRDHGRFRSHAKCGLDSLLCGNRRHWRSLRRRHKGQRRGAGNQCNGEGTFTVLHDFLLHFRIVMPEEISQFQNECSLNPPFRFWRDCHCLGPNVSVCAREQRDDEPSFGSRELWCAWSPKRPYV